MKLPRDCRWRSLAHSVAVFIILCSSTRLAVRAHGQAVWINQTPNLTGLAYSNGRFVAVGEDDEVLTSADLLYWERHSTGVLASLSSVAFGNGAFVAVGSHRCPAGDVNCSSYEAIILRSTNGADWSVQPFGTNSSIRVPSLNSIAFLNNQFVAVGFEENILSSPDGVTWNQQFGIPNFSSLSGIAFGNGTYVAVGGFQLLGPPYTMFGEVFQSPNSQPWAMVPHTDEPGYLSDVAFGNGRFVAVALNGKIRISTPDGWQTTTTNLPACTSIAYGRGLFVTVGPFGTIQSSTDGVTWTPQSSGTATTFNRVAFANDTFVAVGASGTIVASPDGMAWSVLQSSPTSPYVGFGGIAFGNGTFVTVTRNIILTSSNGFAWKTQTVDTNLSLERVTFGANRFVAVGNRDRDFGTVLVSSDATNWNEPVIPFVYDATTVAFAKDRFFVATANGPMLTSTDGSAWTIPDTNVLASAIAYGNGIYLGVGGLGSSYGLIASDDGVNWRTLQTSLQKVSVFEGGLTFGKGLFVAAGYDTKQISTSTNGVDWQARHSDGFPYQYVTFLNDSFLAVGANGYGGAAEILNSNDGISWSRCPGLFHYPYSSIAYGNGVFVGLTGAVGYGNGTTISSDGDGQIGLSAPAPLLQSQRLLPSGAFEFQISSPLAQRVSVQSSSDLSDWRTIETLQVTNGWSVFQDPTATNSPRRLYRILWSAP
jgi:hypothetical protein